MNAFLTKIATREVLIPPAVEPVQPPQNINSSIMHFEIVGHLSKSILAKPVVLYTEAALANVDKDIKVAVMGCVVNGPGEAREADIGIAGGDGCAVLFKKGEVLRKIPESEIVTELMKEIEKF